MQKNMVEKVKGNKKAPKEKSIIDVAKSSIVDGIVDGLIESSSDDDAIDIDKEIENDQLFGNGVENEVILEY